MTDLLAAALSEKLATLPFIGTAYGLVRTQEEQKSVPGTEDTRLIRYPVPLTEPEACAGPFQLLPSAAVGSALWFEDDGTVLPSLVPYQQFTSTLRLVGWLNTARLDQPLAQGALLGVLVDVLKGSLTVPGLSNVKVAPTTLLPGDGATLFNRYTLTDDTRPLLRLPYVFFGITLKVTGILSACGPDLPSLTDPSVC